MVSTGAAKGYIIKGTRVQQPSIAEVILTSITDGVVTLDQAGVISSINPAAAEILGLEPDQVLDQPYGVVFFMQEENDAFNQLLLDLVTSLETRPYAEVPFRRDDGDLRYLALTTALLQEDDRERLGAVLVFKDITAVHKLREQRDELARDLEAKHKELSEAYLKLEERNSDLQESHKRLPWVKLGVGVAALILVLGALYWAWPRSGGGRSVGGIPAPSMGSHAGLRSVKARTGDLRETVSCRGYIEPLITVTVSAQVSGRVEKRFVELGQRVKKGALLMQLSRDEVEPKVRAAEATVLKTRQQVAEMKSWTRRPEFKQAERRVDLAKLELKRKENRLKESERLYKEGIIPRDDLDNARADARRAQADLAESEERVMTVRERGSKDKLRVARLELMNAEAALREAREKLEHTNVRAPSAGVVMRPAGDKDKKDARIPELGDKVSEGQALLAVGVEQPLGVKASVDEVAVRQVRQGQRAVISGPALGGATLKGRVRSVAPQATLEGRVPMFPVMIELQDLPPEKARALRLGMTASVRVVVREQKHAVLVPIVAVKRHDGDESVRVPGPEGPVWRKVRTGLSDAEFIQITEGLAAGQVVLY